jgi:toxin FitB
MYLLDTNVISEAKRRNPFAVRWIEQTRVEDLHVCVVSLTEISKGAHLIERRDEVRAAAIFKWLRVLEAQFSSRIIAIDQSVAVECGRVAAITTRGEMDCLIAAAAIVHGLTLVTRNVRNFEDTGVKLMNPWAET